MKIALVKDCPAGKGFLLSQLACEKLLARKDCAFRFALLEKEWRYRTGIWLSRGRQECFNPNDKNTLYFRDDGNGDTYYDFRDDGSVDEDAIFNHPYECEVKLPFGALEAQQEILEVLDTDTDQAKRWIRFVNRSPKVIAYPAQGVRFPGDISQRTDPALIEILEELGPKALYANSSRVIVVEIPDGMQYEILGPFDDDYPCYGEALLYGPSISWA